MRGARNCHKMKERSRDGQSSRQQLGRHKTQTHAIAGMHAAGKAAMLLLPHQNWHVSQCLSTRQMNSISTARLSTKQSLFPGLLTQMHAASPHSLQTAAAYTRPFSTSGVPHTKQHPGPAQQPVVRAAVQPNYSKLVKCCRLKLMDPKSSILMWGINM